MNPAIPAAAVHIARKMGEKTCPWCGKVLNRIHRSWQCDYVWAHHARYIDGFPLADSPVCGWAECDYSEPERANHGRGKHHA